MIVSQKSFQNKNEMDVTFDDPTSGNAHFSVGNGLPGVTIANAGKYLRVASNGINLACNPFTEVSGAFSITVSPHITG